ncbi:MAG TPA: putative O-glycosylation ligase, exosortase A system-associated, partial [Bryobacteraceae bacterium]|nr:putative O-glycosylation ligase, exosortase A system-associated [Bryobacteraceae bacterium]
MRDIIVLTLILGSLPLCFFRPFFGILMWTVVSLLNPHRFAWGMAYNFPVALLVAVPTLIGAALFERGWKYFFSKTVWLIVVLWLWFTLTSLRNTEMPEFTHFAQDTWQRWQEVSKVLLMTLATAGIVNSWYRFRWFLLVIAGCFGILILKAVPFMILTGGAFRLYGPPGSMIADNNDFGLALNMTLPIFFFLASQEPSRRIRRLMGVCFVATIPAIFFTYSRGALIGLAVVLFFMVLRSRKRVVLVPVLVLAAIFAVFLTPERWQKRMDFRKEGTLVDDSARERLNAWTYSWRLALDYPLTGGGFEAFTPTLFNRYAPDPRDVHGPHSIYFGVLAEHGFIGLFLYLLLLASTFMNLRQVHKYARSWGDERANNYAFMLQFSLLAFMISGAFLGRAYFDYYFTIVACTVILRRQCQSEQAKALSADLAAPADS